MYYTDGIQLLNVTPGDMQLVVRAATVYTDKVVQAYIAGTLLAWQSPASGAVCFHLPALGDGQMVFLLAVDPDQAETNFWAEATGPAGTGAGGVNRIGVQTPQTIAPYGLHDVWKVYLADAGEPDGAPVHQQDFYPGGTRAGGFGASLGPGGWGWDGDGAVGLGSSFGYGEFGFDCEMLSWTSQPLAPGTYTVRATVTDGDGNESPAAEATVTLAGYPRPPRDLAVVSYDRASDTLQLSFTPSPDV